MVRVANTKRQIAMNLLRYVQNDINTINKALTEEEDLENKLDATYISTRNQVAIDAGNEIVKKIRWYMETEIGQSLQTPHTDNDIDTIDPDIRTHEE